MQATAMPVLFPAARVSNSGSIQNVEEFKEYKNMGFLLAVHLRTI